MPEFDVYPTASRVAEGATTTLVNYARRDAADYTLNPNTKIQVATEINELALRKGSASYFATLRQAMVREVSYQIQKQIFNGTNGAQQFHGILQSVIPATVANKRGAFDVTADTNIAAETNRFRKLVLMLGTLPSNLSDGDLNDYMWVMNRNTWYQKIVPSLDGQSRYYMDAVMQGIPLLVGPGGIPVKIVATDSVGDGIAILAPMSKYYLAMPDGVEMRDDGGIVNFNAGTTLLKAFTFADGGYVRNFMRTSGWTTGNDDNRDRNLWRVITGL
jgi:HK97 family phage major capsid protein